MDGKIFQDQVVSCTEHHGHFTTIEPAVPDHLIEFIPRCVSSDRSHLPVVFTCTLSTGSIHPAANQDEVGRNFL